MKAWIGVSVCILAGCAPPEPAEKGWLFGIYMAADNNLDPYASLDLRELLPGKLASGLQVDVLIDRAAEGAYADVNVNGIRRTDGALLLRITPQGIEELEDWGEVDTSDPATLNRFAKHLLDQNIENNVLHLWNHGSGTSFGLDETAGGILSTSELMAALREDPLDPTSDRMHFEVLSFDACLMSTVDAFMALGPYSDVYIASAELTPGRGWAYDTFMDELDGTLDTLDAKGWAEAAVTAYGKHYLEDDPKEAGGIDITLAAWDSSKIPEMQAAFDTLETDLNDQADASDAAKTATYAAVSSALGASYAYDRPQVGERARFADTGPSLRGLEGATIGDDADALEAAIQSAQIAYVGGEARPGSQGMAFVIRPELRPEVDASSASALSRVLNDPEFTDAVENTDQEDPTSELSNISYDGSDPAVPWIYSSAKAGDDTLLDHVYYIVGEPAGDGMQFHGVFSPAAWGTTSYEEDVGVPALVWGLTDASAETLGEGDDGVLVWEMESGRLPVQVTVPTDTLLHDGDILLDEDLQPAGLRIEQYLGSVAVLPWDEELLMGIEVAPLHATFSDITDELATTPGRFRPAIGQQITRIPLPEAITEVRLVVDDGVGNRAVADATIGAP